MFLCSKRIWKTSGLRGCRPATGEKSRDPGEVSECGSRHRSRCATEPTWVAALSLVLSLAREKQEQRADTPGTAARNLQPCPGSPSWASAPAGTRGPPQAGSRVLTGYLRGTRTSRPAQEPPAPPATFLERTPSKWGSAVCKLHLHGVDFF